jgi:2-octaprenyl-6-methoxyphenol hydroxylase
MTTDVDITIVGGGAVGNTLALALEALSIPVALLEASDPLSIHSQQDGRAIALTYGSSQIFHDLNVWAALLPAATALHAVHVSKRGGFGFTTFEAAKLGVPALGYVVDMSALLATLSAAVGTAKHCQRIAPAKVTTIERQETCWQLCYTQGEATKHITTKLLIAADGANSTVRRLVNAKVHEKDYGEHAFVANIELAGDHHHVAYERFTAQGSVAMLPRGDRQCKVVWTLPSEKARDILQEDRLVLLKTLQDRFGYRLGRFINLEKPISFPLRYVFMPEQVFPGLVFLGNAAHSIHPIAAQGLNLGLRDLVVLVDTLRMAQHDHQVINDFAILKAYMAKRRPAQKHMMRFTHRLTEIFTTTIPGMSFASDSGMFLLNKISPLKKVLARALMGLPSF